MKKINKKNNFPSIKTNSFFICLYSFKEIYYFVILSYLFLFGINSMEVLEKGDITEIKKSAASSTQGDNKMSNEAQKKGHAQENTRFIIDLGSSGVQAGGFVIDFSKQIIEKQFFNRKERILLQAGIQNRILPEEIQQRTVSAVKKLLKEAQVDPHKTKIYGFATAWARDAHNSHELVEAIQSETGVAIRIIDQKTEGEIGFHAILALLRSSVSDANSFLYQAEKGRDVWHKITGKDSMEYPDLSARIIAESLVSWDIGGGSMQFARQNEHKKIEVAGSTDSSTVFANYVISEIKKQAVNTPNPLSGQEREEAIQLSIRRAEKLSSDSFLGSVDLSRKVVFGVGAMHKSNREYINKLLDIAYEHFYTLPDLETASLLLVDKGNADIAEALGIKEADARNRFTSMLLVLGFMRHLAIERVQTINDVTGMTGIFFMDQYIKP